MSPPALGGHRTKHKESANLVRRGTSLPDY